MNKNNFLILLLSILSSYQVYSQNTILWKVTDTINNKTSYLVGTYHQFGNSFVDSIPEIKACLLKSDIAVFESIEKVEDVRKVIENREPSYKIKKYLKKKDLLKLSEITKNWEVDLYKLKPIEIRWKLQQEYQKIVCKTSQPTDSFDLFDDYLIHLAEVNGIKQVALETNQLSIIEQENNYPSWKKERKNIRIWINKLNSDEATDENCALANRYRAFDLDYEFNKECDDNYIIYERNNLWMKKLPKLIRNNNVFIAVGHYHLRWKCGLLEQLRSEGFKIEPITIKQVE